MLDPSDRRLENPGRKRSCTRGCGSQRILLHRRVVDTKMPSRVRCVSMQSQTTFDRLRNFRTFQAPMKIVSSSCLAVAPLAYAWQGNRSDCGRTGGEIT